MADIATFPTIHDVLYAGDNIQSFTASEAIKAGQAVGFAAAGVSLSVVPLDNTAGENAVGVALYDAAIGEKVAVACMGCICYVANADDGTVIDNSVKGTVSEHAFGAVEGTYLLIGQAIEDIAGGGTGRIMVMPYVSDEEVAA